ncbi:UDP-glucose/GDP-mannose dehydrogenase family protein [bacterium]|nr:UDP-glucose/GDP-mannose dehydrogenase family protein [bacterium]
MKVTVIGTGFVGVTTSAVYAKQKHTVVGLDVDEQKINSLNAGKVPFFEPKLQELVQSGLKSKKLSFTTSYQEAVTDSDVVMIAVGTPSRPDGSINLDYVKESAKQAAPYLKDDAVLVIKSTVLPGTLEQIKPIVKNITDKKIHYASLPEFLKEGTAVDDTLYPDRIAIGVEDDFAWEVLSKLHAAFKAPLVRVRPASAQLAKYASNDYLALRIVYANVLADVCEQAGADVDEVLEIMGHEKRIGSHYWYPGLGYGGSCFPKDVKALAAFVDEFESPERNLFRFINKLNVMRPADVVEKLTQVAGKLKGKKVAVLGLAFKPNTDDQREAPALFLIPQLLEKGAKVVSYDPMVKKIASEQIATHKHYEQVRSIKQAITDADIIVALIEWPEITDYKFKNNTDKKVIFLDARNQFDQQTIAKAGYEYLGIGRQRLETSN